MPVFDWGTLESCLGVIEEFDDVEDFLPCLMDGDARAKLQDAAGVGGDDGLSAGGLRVAHFFGE